MRLALAVAEAPPANPETAPPELVLSRAAVRAGRKLGLTNRQLGAALGVAPSTVSRVAARDKAIGNAKALELAAVIVRLYETLHMITAADDRLARDWMRRENTALGGRPAELIGSVAGLMRCAGYLDACGSDL